MGGGVSSAGDHAIGQALVHHHGGEVGNILHRLASLLEGYALLLAQLGKVGGEFLCQRGLEVVDDLGTSQVELQLFGAGLDIGLVAQDGQLGNLIAQYHVGGLEDAVIVALWQDDVGTGGAGLVNELLLEEVCGHDRGDVAKRSKCARNRFQVGEDASDGSPQGFRIVLGKLAGALRGAGNDGQRQAKGGSYFSIEGDIAGALRHDVLSGGSLSQDGGDGGIEVFEADELRAQVLSQGGHIEAIEATADSANNCGMRCRHAIYLSFTVT